jgi:hypothetical protein
LQHAVRDTQPLADITRGAACQAQHLLQQQASLSQALGSLLHPHTAGNTDMTLPDDISSARYTGYITMSEADLAVLLKGCGRAVSLELPQQLQEFGAAMCAALPSKLCCNAPGCCSCEQLSEAELVGGKLSVCSGCKTARWVRMQTPATFSTPLPWCGLCARICDTMFHLPHAAPASG